MASGYIDWGDDDVKSAMQLGILHQQRMKEQGKNFFGQELKVDPSKATTTTTTPKPATVSNFTAFDIKNKDLTKVANNTLKANEAVGSLNAAHMQGLKILETAPNIFSSAASMTPEMTQAVANAGSAAQTANLGINSAQYASAGGAAAAAGTASTGLQAAASSAMPWLIGAQIMLGLLGSKDDEEGWIGIRPTDPWGSSGPGGTGVVG